MRGGQIMRGKKPKERDSYVLRMEDGTLVEVSREIYLEWYQSRRQERYQQERSRKRGTYSLDELEETGNYSHMPLYVCRGVEEIVLRNLCKDKIKETLSNLTDSDAELIELLYFKGFTVTEAAEICGCCRNTIQNRRKRILRELRKMLQEQGIQGGYF